MSTKIVKIGDFDDAERRKQEDRVFVLEQMIEKIQSGDITEFVIAATNPKGDVEISMFTEDVLGAIGMFEIGKHILMSGEVGGQIRDIDDDEE
jgi:hypothetical protein